MPYDRILELMSAPTCSSIHLLGPFAKRLTVYSQQIRAVNLVDAIQWYRRPLAAARVAVVGAGVAGLTAAAWSSIWAQTSRWSSASNSRSSSN